MTNAHFKSGFACLVGRPNAGKSTLTNALVGQKVAITSGRPQTTRHTVRGIITREDAQLILIDTPGLHRPRTLLGERLNTLVSDTLAEVDVIVFCLPADQRIGPGDRYIAAQLAGVTGGRRGPRVVAVATKSDLVAPERLAEHLIEISELGSWEQIVPVSATGGYQVDHLADVLVKELPEGPMLYPEGELTDEPEAVMVAELVREAALEGVRDELPHSLAVVVEEMGLRDGRDESHRLVDIHAIIYVERPSQKAIIIGKSGSRLRSVGTKARVEIERLLGDRVYLDLHVKVAKDWQRDPKQLAKLGF
ncbi:GTPase Era [Rarobacter faecitabidus]|uniref:GTPase Era n=1 Tax=Rarobacter faecitabidus TaxID=13243 RepID=A0A542ZUZ5_RARFA|nr:GTP-binding protein Era [Rarobacter faecitabidus]